MRLVSLKDYFLRRSLWFHLGMFAAFSSCAAHAQSVIIPDQLLPVNSIITPENGSTVFGIDGGTVRGTNLFHSFESFSIPQESTVIFRPDTRITDVLSRVTGNQASYINGRLQVTGDANFFLINPNGVIFGADASLNVGGSIVATTAERLLFEGDSVFAAAQPENTLPLLSLSRPNGLQFGNAPGTIRNRSQSLDVQGSIRGLHVQPGNTLALIGGALEIEGGYIVSPQSSIELGGVGSNSLVKLTFTDSRILAGYEEVTQFSDIKLSDLALVDSSGFSGGRINIQGQNISVTDGSRIFSHTFENGIGEDILINASESFEVVGVTEEDGVFDQDLQGSGILIAQRSIVASELFGNGEGGDLFIQAQNIRIRNGGNLNTSLFGSGMGGNLDLNASQLIEISGKTELLAIPSELVEIAQILGIPQNFFGEISTASTVAVANLSTGKSGTLNITSNSLLIRDGGLLSANPTSSGPGGNVNLLVDESLDLLGAADNGVYASAITIGPLILGSEEQVLGQPGNLNINTSRFRILDGARVGLDTGRVSGGLAVIEARESIEISGRSSSGNLRSTISARSTVEGNGGRIDIETGLLNLSNHGIILAGGSNTLDPNGPRVFDFENQPRGGDINVLANSIKLDNFAEISTAAESNLGGNIGLNVGDVLLLRHGSTISAQAGATGTGGNIFIRASILAAPRLENSDIIATAVAGAGGEIDITTQGIVGLQISDQLTPNSDISASSEVGLDGRVSIDSPNTELDSTQIEFDETFAPPNLAAGCYTAQSHSGRFVLTGRGGLPDNPANSVSLDSLWQDLEPLPTASLSAQQIAASATNTAPLNKPIAQAELQEANAWKLDNQGQIQLITMEEEPIALPTTASCTLSSRPSYPNRTK